MRSPFDALPQDAIADVLREQWGLEVASLVEVPVGAGAYHWTAADTDGRRWFVTVDDLDTKPWLGDDRTSVFGGLLAAYAIAVEVLHAGAAFVVASVPSRSGAPAVRLDDRHSLAVFDHVVGEPGEWGGPLDAHAADELVGLLAALHGATAPAAQRPLALPGRSAFDRLLADLDEPWRGGPLAEPARQLLRGDLPQITAMLTHLDRAAARAAGSFVLTHGEPHPGNLIRTTNGLRLVDWDTVASAPPERDLWMLTHLDPNLADRYADLTGRSLDSELLAAYRTLWALADLASYGDQLHAAHVGNADDHHALAAISRILDGSEPQPYRAR